MLRFVVLLLFASAVAAAPVPKALKAKSPSLDGRWEIVELKVGDSDVTNLNPWVWDISGEQLAIYNRENGTLRLNDPNTKTTLVRPPSGGAEDIDYIRDAGNPQVLKGLIVVDGDELTICHSDQDKPRPKECKSVAWLSYYRFKRVKEK